MKSVIRTATGASLALLSLALVFSQLAQAVDWPHSYPPNDVGNCTILKPHNHRGSVRSCATIQTLQAQWYGTGQHWVWVPKANKPGAGWQDAESKLKQLDRNCRVLTRKLDKGKLVDTKQRRNRQRRICS